jgi:hypothetical protein
MDPPELASKPTVCYARRGRIEPPLFALLGYQFPVVNRCLYLTLKSEHQIKARGPFRMDGWMDDCPTRVVVTNRVFGEGGSGEVKQIIAIIG